MFTKKQKGYQWEELVAKYYQDNGCKILEQNYTIPWGEIDIIAQGWETLYFVEVKVVDAILEMDNYITHRKITFLERCIENYLARHDCDDLLLQIDVVFVKQGHIVERFKNITNS